MTVAEPNNSYRRRSSGVAAARILAGRWLLAGMLFYGAASQPASSQEMSFTALRESAREAMGGQELERIEFTGRGWDACLGQAWSVQEGWARWEVERYRRVIDYGASSSVQSATRRPGMDPERLGGCGAQPDGRPMEQETRVDADSAWAEQLPIWMTPHGFLKLAEEGETSVASDGSGWAVTVRTARGGTTYVLQGRYDSEFLLERVRTSVDNPIFGDMEVEAEFRDWREFDELVFPSALIRREGGSATLDLTIDDVVPNTQSPVPASSGGRRSGPGGDTPDPPYVEIGDGVFAILGAYQAVAVEFDDFSVVIDGMQNESRTREVIRLTREAIPGKAIRYVVNTHSHFDHASGLRQFAAEGATVLTHHMNVAFFENALNTPRTLNGGESLPADGYEARVQGVDGRMVIDGDGGQVLELHELAPGRHAADMLVAYLPNTGTVVEADLLQPWINPVFGGDGDEPHPYLVYLHDELERLPIDYEQFVPVHQPADPPTMQKSALIEAVSR